MNWERKILYLLLTIIILQKTILCSNAITFDLPKKARLGNNLLNYIKAKWISYKYGIPIFCPYFEHSEKFMFGNIEEKFNENIINNFKHVIHFEDFIKKLKGQNINLIDIKKFLKIKEEDSCLYISHLFSNIHFDWKDKNFIKEIKKMLTPIIDVKKPTIPENCLSVAMHVRKGGGYDNKNIKKQFVQKFPSDKYYIDQINTLYILFNKTPIHVHIFTDDPNPEEIVKKYKKEINKENITFSSRHNGNNYENNLIEDLFSMTHYDCLIRPRSSFSICAEIIGDFFTVIYPDNNNLYQDRKSGEINKTQIKINMENLHKISKITVPYFIITNFIPIKDYNIYFSYWDQNPAFIQ